MPLPGALLPKSFSWQRQWWLWPHLLSLDAPLIAVLWQMLLARDLRISLNQGEPWVLALCVWCVYLGDRILDAVRTPVAGWEPVRKKFYRRYLRFAAVAAFCLLISALPLAYRLLRHPTFWAGLVLVIPLFSYLAFVHLAPVQWRARWPREMAVACVFTCGVFLALWISNGRSFRHLWAPAVLFLLLCWMNCCFIETREWQEDIRRMSEKPSSSAQWATRYLPLLALGIASLAVLMEHTILIPLHFSIAAFFSGVVLATLAACRPHLPMNSLCVLADFALCTPLPILFSHLL